MNRLSNYKQKLLRKKVKNARNFYQSNVSESSIESNTETEMESSSDVVSSDEERESYQPVVEPGTASDGDDYHVHDSDDSDDTDQDDTDLDETDIEDTDLDDNDIETSDAHDVKEETAMLILQYFLRHNLTWVALDELLTLINRILEMKTPAVPKSKYLFQKVLPDTEAPVIHFYCRKCTAYVGEEKQLIEKFPGKVVKCLNCQYEFNLKSKNNAVFFAQLKLEHQLRNIVRKFQNHFTTNQENDDNTTYDDVTSGEYYKSLKQKIPDLLSFTFNTDGVNIFKSKKKSSLWPLLMVVNEVPKEHRFKRENMIVAGLWYGTDPDFSMYLKPFIDDLRDLNKNKFSVKVKHGNLSFTVCAIIFSADTPAKAKVLNCMLFNGFYGCPYCFHPGKNEDGTIRYPLMVEIEKRTHECVVHDAMKVLKMRAEGLKCIDVRGIKGPTPLLLLPEFDVVKGSPVDYLHFALHGITGKISGLWFDTHNHNENFYIGRPNQITIIDDNIAAIRPPKSFTRYPRSIGDRAFYKASEQLNWLLHYGAACVDTILPNVYLKHFQLFSSSIFILNKDEISAKELEEAEKRLKQFAVEFPRLYGSENEVFNEHLVTHVTDSVRNCGPLWSYSNFPFEDMNGVLKSYVNGTTDVIKQVASKFLLNTKLREKLGEEYKTVKRLRKNVEKLGDVILFGKAQLPTVEIKNKISNLISKVEMTKLRFYKSCSVKSNFVKCFDVKTKCDDSIIKSESGEYHRVYHIYKLNNDVYFCTKKIETSKSNTTLYVEHLKTIQSESAMQILSSTEFSEKCIHIKTTRHSFISLFPNNVERY